MESTPKAYRLEASNAAPSISTMTGTSPFYRLLLPKRQTSPYPCNNVVALARKLFVALWKYVTAGVVIEGAVIKTA